MGDGFLPRFEVSALDRFVDRIADELRYPDIRLPVPRSRRDLRRR